MVQLFSIRLESRSSEPSVPTLQHSCTHTDTQLTDPTEKVLGQTSEIAADAAPSVLAFRCHEDYSKLLCMPGPDSDSDHEHERLVSKWLEEIDPMTFEACTASLAHQYSFYKQHLSPGSENTLQASMDTLYWEEDVQYTVGLDGNA